MFNHRKPYFLLIVCALLALMMTGCFRDSSEEAAEPAVARELPSATPNDEAPAAAPTETSTPGDAPDTFALTATAVIARLTPTVEAAAAEPTPAEVSAPTATPLPPVDDGPVPTVVPLIRATVPPGADCVHQIRSGETLSMLSRAYGLSIAEIASANGISDPNQIAIGQRITIPQCGTTGFLPPPTSAPAVPTSAPVVAAAPTAADAPADAPAADALDSEAVQQAQDQLLDNARAELGAEAELAAASENAPDSGDAASESSRQSYTVQQFDTLFSIAQRFDTTVEELAALNNISDVDSLPQGTVLQIP